MRHSNAKGYRRLSPISVPIKAFQCRREEGPHVRLNQLHRNCMNRIKYQKICLMHGVLCRLGWALLACYSQPLTILSLLSFSSSFFVPSVVTFASSLCPRLPCGT
jgi:hypothetical protein